MKFFTIFCLFLVLMSFFFTCVQGTGSRYNYIQDGANFCAKQDFQGALNVYNQEIATSNGCTIAMGLKAVVLHKLGRNDEAKESIERLSECNMLADSSIKGTIGQLVICGNNMCGLSEGDMQKFKVDMEKMFANNNLESVSLNSINSKPVTSAKLLQIGL